MNMDNLLNNNFLKEIINNINNSIFKDTILSQEVLLSIGKVKDIKDLNHKGRIVIQDIFLHSDNVPLDILPVAEPLLDNSTFILPKIGDFVFVILYKMEKSLNYSYFYFGNIRKEKDFWDTNYNSDDIPKIDTLFKRIDNDSHFLQINNNREDDFIEMLVKKDNDNYLQSFTIDVKNKKISNKISLNNNKLNFELDISNLKSTFELKNISNSISLVNDVLNNESKYTVKSSTDKSIVKVTNTKMEVNGGTISSISDIEVCGITPISGNVVGSVVRSDKLNSYFKYLIDTQLNSIWKSVFNTHIHIGYIGNFGAPIIPVPNVQPQLQNLPVPGQLGTVGFNTN